MLNTPKQQGNPIQMRMQDVVDELTSTPLGAALWDRAQFAVLVRQQEEELQYLRSLTDRSDSKSEG